MADTVIEAHQLLHPFLVARQCPAGARRSASSVARAFVVGSQPPVLAVRAGAGLWPAGCHQGWSAADRPRDRLGGCWWPPQPRGCIPNGTVAH